MGLLRTAIDRTTGLLCYLKKSRRYGGDAGEVKLNLGCGLAVAKGWINIDGSLNSLVAPWPQLAHKLLYRFSGARRYYSLQQYCGILSCHRFLHWDLAYGIPFPDASVAYIYTSHFMEHLFKKDAAALLKEARRVLKPGGVLRISVPDLEYALSLYAAGEKRRMLSDYFFVEDLESFLARHKYMYDFELLSEVLREAGFSDVRRCSFGQGAVPDLETLDNRPEDSLFVEASA